MGEKLGVEILPVASAREALEGADIASFCTDSVKPVLPDAGWVVPGMHFTSVLHSEIGDAPTRADVIVLHERGGIVAQQALGEDGEAPGGEEAGMRVPYGMWLERDRPDLPTLAELVAGRATGRTSPQEVTYFHNIPGAGVQFAAVGARVYQLAREREAGSHIPTEWFTQDIRD
jgi:ornithine cyclodeaminase/alanine dehydrogenase-like protein (mu-crystallin family)